VNMFVLSLSISLCVRDKPVPKHNQMRAYTGVE
jgi:hypothetical protein